MIRPWIIAFIISGRLMFGVERIIAAAATSSIRDFPGIHSGVLLLNDGGLRSNLATPCKDNIPQLSEACLNTLKALPAMIDLLLDHTASDLKDEEKFQDIISELPSMEDICGGCDFRDAEKAILEAEKDFKDEFGNPTCSGLIPDIISPPDFVKTIIAGYSALCAKNDE